MNLFKTFAVDEKKVTKGVWHVIEPASSFAVAESEIGDRSAVLVGSMDNPAYREAIERRSKPLMMRHGAKMDAEMRDRLTMEAIAEVVILDWKNWDLQGDGVHVPYSHAVAVDILTNLKWIRLRERLLAIMGDVEAYRVDQEEAVAKNS
jgi:hypothetical protein